MEKTSSNFKNSPVWFVSIIVSIGVIIFFIYLPFQIDMFQNDVVKQVYYVDNISEAHQKIIEKFNQKYLGEIEVVPVNLPFHSFTTNDRKAILARSLRNRSDGIDIFAVDLIWIPRFAKWGYSLDRRFNKDVLGKINDRVLEACYNENSLVAFPNYLDMGVLHYRKDRILSLPDGEKINDDIQKSLTWKEFIALGRKHKTELSPYYIFTGNDYEGFICCFDEMITYNAVQNLFNSSPVDLNTNENIRALQQMVDFIYKYNFSPPETKGFDEFNSYLYALNNDATFLRGWVGFHKQYKKFIEDSSKVELFDVAPLPHFEGQERTSVFGGWSLMISKYSERKEEAIKFMRFMFEAENQKLLYESGGVLPVNDEVYTDSTFISKHAELKQYRKLFKWCKHRPALENYTRISEIMSKSFHKALRNEISVVDALNEASNKINNEKFIK